MSWFVIGLDAGNGELKIVSDQIDRLAVGGVLGRYKETTGKTRLSKDSNVTLYQVESDTQKWAIGYEDVDKLSLTPILITGRDALNRYSSNLYSVYAKIGMAKAIGNKRPEKIMLITSTPARDALDQKVINKLSEILFDSHKVKINDERVLLNVMRHEAISETEAALYDVYLADNGLVADDSVESQDTLVINAGYGTTDVSRFNRLEYVPLDRETVKTAYYDVINGSKEWLESQVGREITAQEVTLQLSKQKESARKVFEYVSEEVAGFDDVYQEKVKSVWDDLVAELNIIVPDPDRYNKIFVVGGGAVIWGDQFKKWSRRVSIPSDPQFSAARGLWKYGVYLRNEELEDTAATKE